MSLFASRLLRRRFSGFEASKSFEFKNVHQDKFVFDQQIPEASIMIFGETVKTFLYESVPHTTPASAGLGCDMGANASTQHILDVDVCCPCKNESQHLRDLKGRSAGWDKQGSLEYEANGEDGVRARSSRSVSPEVGGLFFCCIVLFTVVVNH